jgi:hypothetical protein
VSLLDALIAQGMKNNEDFTKELIEIKKRVENTKERQRLQELENVTQAMQGIDDFTLQQNATVSNDTQAMKNIDDFTLQQVNDLNTRVSELENKSSGGMN